MTHTLEITPVAHIRSDFDSKFAVPRQPGLVKEIRSEIILDEDYRKDGILRGLESFSHLWIIFGFSENYGHAWSPTVRPPRFGGDTRLGVFATRSPFRPNPIGLSAVKIEEIRKNSIIVSGADLVNGTPIYDIKPYIPFADAIPDASEGFAPAPDTAKLTVVFAEGTLDLIPQEKQQTLHDILACDPRPPYHHDPERIYGFSFAGLEIKFRVAENTLYVTKVEP